MTKYLEIKLWRCPADPLLLVFANLMNLQLLLQAVWASFGKLCSMRRATAVIVVFGAKAFFV